MKIKKYISSTIFFGIIISFLILFIVLPKSSYSSNEKRVLDEFPKFSVSSVTDGSFGKGLESYLSDHFPFRNFFVGVNSYFELFTGKNGNSGIYSGKDGYLISAPTSFEKSTVVNNAKRFSDFAEKVSINANLIIVPYTGYVMNNELPPLHEEYKDDEIFSIASQNLHNINLLDLRDAFKARKDDTQLYYKTDHHLTSAGAYIMYEEFCKADSIKAAQSFEKEQYPGFYGTTYSRSGLWYKTPDSVELWKDNNLNVAVTIDDESSLKTSDSIFFTSHLDEDDKYPVFLDGNHALVKIENKNCKNGKKLLIINDSFAHCFAGFLCENYSEIYMVDLRYYRKPVSDLIKKNGINEMLFVYGTENFSTDTNSAWLQ